MFLPENVVVMGGLPGAEARQRKGSMIDILSIANRTMDYVLVLTGGIIVLLWVYAVGMVLVEAIHDGRFVMAYEELRGYFSDYHAEKITRSELIAAIGLYQRRNHIEAKDARRK
jgi:hypothetical protein